ncbi:MAG: MATE family efflux transporter [Deltaproteobacteria bacterium]|nr:MATE family efflux transporter [Deltaproteobacteria bacterium]
MRRKKLLTAPVGRTLIDLAVPMMIGIAAVLFFNLVDTFWVGQLGGLELAAMGFTFPVVMVVMNLTIGLSIGSTAVIAASLGEGQEGDTRRLATDALILALVLVTAVSAVGVLTIEPLFRALGAEEDTLPLIREYMEPWYLGVGLLVIPMVGNGAIRATGDTKTPSVVMVIIGLFNAGLDPLLIFGWGPFPALGLRGAAYATVGSYIGAFVVAGWVLARREKLIAFEIPRPSQVVASWRRILRIGLPAAGTNLLTPLAAGAITRVVSSHGPEAVAAYGAGTRVEGLAMMGVYAMTAALTPFVGQNHGAGQIDRIRETLRFNVKVATVWGLGAAALLALLASPLARLLNDDPAIVEYTELFLWIVPASYIPYGIALLVAAMYNAMEMPLKATMLAALRLIALAVPLAWLGSHLFGLPGLFGGIVAANVLMGVTAALVIRRDLLSKCDASGTVPT